MLKNYYIYMMCSENNRALYIGMTNDLVRRVAEHKAKKLDGFSRKYNTIKLVHFEIGNDVKAVIAREKQLKGWLREKKNALINASNSEWRDLYPDIV